MIARRHGSILLTLLALVLIGFFLAPILLLLLPTSFPRYTPGQGFAPGVWTLENYMRIVTDGFYLEVIARTLTLGLLTTLACLLLGYPLAYVIARGPARWRTALILAVTFPILLNLVVRSFGWIALLANRGLVNNQLTQLGLISSPLKLMYNLTGLMIGLTHIYLPFMVFMLDAAIRNVPREVEAAAATLGSNRLHVFTAVTLPLSAPGILSGSILVFVLTISALVTPRMLGGPTYKVMATMIHDEYMQLLDWASGSALSFTLAAMALGVIRASSRLTKRWAGLA